MRVEKREIPKPPCEYVVTLSEKEVECLLHVGNWSRVVSDTVARKGETGIGEPDSDEIYDVLVNLFRKLRSKQQGAKPMLISIYTNKPLTFSLVDDYVTLYIDHLNTIGMRVGEMDALCAEWAKVKEETKRAA